MAELAAGRLHLFFTPVANAIGLARDGRVALLATHSVERPPAAPEVPGAAEQGFPGFSAEGLIAAFAGPGTADADLARLAASAHAVVREQGVLPGQLPRNEGPAPLAAILTGQRARFAPLARAFPLPK